MYSNVQMRQDVFVLFLLELLGATDSVKSRVLGKECFLKLSVRRGQRQMYIGWRIVANETFFHAIVITKKYRIRSNTERKKCAHYKFLCGSVRP